MVNNCPLCGNQMPEKRIYTMEEVRKICKDLGNMETHVADSILDELKTAMREGRIKE